MKKSYKFILSIILILPVFTGFSQGHRFKSEKSPALGAADSRFTVTATVMDDDTWCRVEWPDPVSNPWEMAFDDGEADDYFIYQNPGSLNANKFIPTFHPFIVTGGKIYVGDGSFPGPFLGTSFRVLVYDDDGDGELPGTALDSIDVTVNNYEWVEFEGMTAEITEGDFYLAMKQLAPSPDAAPIGVDTDNPTYFNSYSFFQEPPGWVLSPLQDFMIRAWITGYNEPSRAIDSFAVARFSGFEIYESPLIGDTTILDTLSLSEYDDYYWDTLQAGLYAYGIKTHFTGGEWSDYDVSNPVVHLYYSSPPTCFYQADTGNMPLIGCTPTDINGDIPFNFLGLNLYHNMELVEYFPYWPEPYEYIEYLPQELQPGIHNFYLTAVFDLTPFGYPGETGESAALTTEVVIAYGLPLPFLEQWNSGTFGTNNWLPEGENWSLNGWEGNQPPAAQFTWDPIQTDYSIALESYPLLADSLTEGDIYLDFDLKLDNYLPTGTEQILVQVWNWNSQSWSTVSSYSNEEDSFDWKSEHLDITSQAIETVFKIRFISIGESSLNILGWYLDNIHLYRECIGPDNVSAQFIWYPDPGIEITWDDVPGIIDDLWMQWDDGVNAGNSIGTGDEVEFDCAARWEPSQLSEYEGSVVERVAFFPAESQAEYRIRVWIGAGPANMVVDQLVENPIIGQWNDILLASPINIDITQELWVGYHVNAQTGYPAGVDDGPAIDGYGNMMNFGGWQTLLQINPGLDFNWNIKAFIHRTGNNNEVIKYAVYRQDSYGPLFLRAYSTENEYVDDSAVCINSWAHCYKVTAVYESPTDTCESPLPWWESCEMCMNTNEKKISDELQIYPNPASEAIIIESDEKIESVRIFDSRGITIEQWNNGTLEHWNSGTLKIPVSGLAPGLYLVRVETGSGVVGRKVVIR